MISLISLRINNMERSLEEWLMGIGLVIFIWYLISTMNAIKRIEDKIDGVIKHLEK